MSMRSQSGAALARRQLTHPQLLPKLPEIPRARYVDEAFYRAEIERVYRRSWLLVGHVSEFPQIGSYRVLDLPFAPIFVVRGLDGTLRAFLNSCRHRGVPVATKTEGCARRFTCPYHAWTYDANGKLLGVTLPETFPEFNKDEHSLRSLRCELWGGLIYINFDHAAPALLDWIAPVVQRRYSAGVAVYPDQPLRLATKMSWVVDCNWKAMAENFRESYHIEFVHGETANRLLDPYGIVFEMFHKGQGGKTTPYLPDEKISRDVGFKQPDAATPLPPLPGLDQMREAIATSKHAHDVQLAAHNFFSFPNSVVVWEATGLHFNQIWPLGEDRCRLDYRAYCADWGDGPKPESIERLEAGINNVLAEDRASMQGLQEALEGDPSGSIVVGSQECLLYELHAEIDRLIGTTNIRPELRVPDTEVLRDFIVT